MVEAAAMLCKSPSAKVLLGSNMLAATTMATRLSRVMDPSSLHWELRGIFVCAWYFCSNT
eukprot:2410372-Amphidinium_carterae.1